MQVTFEEGTWAAWLYDLLKPHVTKLVVCDPRKNTRQGNKNDQIDARELADRLYMNKLSSVYHGEAGVRTLKELARSYLTISKDLARVMTRVKAIYRSWGIPCAGKQVYAPRHRAEWLAKITEVGVFRRAEFYYQQLDALRSLRHQVRRELLAESKTHKASKLLCQIPSIGPIRAALLIALIQTPHRFRTKRPLWKYSGFAIETHSSADYRKVQGQLERTKKQVSVRGLNRDCNHDLKNLFKNRGPDSFRVHGVHKRGMRPADLADSQVIRHREHSGDSIRRQSGHIPIRLVRHHSLQSDVSAVHNDVNLRHDAHGVATELRLRVNGPVLSPTNLIVKRRHGQDLNVIHNACYAFDALHCSFSIGLRNIGDNLSLQGHVAAIDLVLQIVKHSVPGQHRQLVVYLLIEPRFITGNCARRFGGTRVRSPDCATRQDE